MIRELLIVAVMFATAAGWYILSLGADVPEAYVFPKTIIAAMVAMAAIQLVESIITARKLKRPSEDRPEFPWKKVCIALSCVVAYFLSMESIGFYASGFLFFLIVTMLLEKEKITIKRIAERSAVAGAFMAVLFVLFHIILAVQTPKGLII